MSDFRPPNILIVQESEISARQLEKILVDTSSVAEVTHVRNGGDACAYLTGEDPFDQCAKPDLVILDLGLPKGGGQIMLRWIKENEAFEDMPVLVVAGSDETADISRASRTRANAYFSFPIDANRLAKTIRNLAFYWSDGHHS